jgi:hypothetical protein
MAQLGDAEGVGTIGEYSFIIALLVGTFLVCRTGAK